MFVVTTLMLGGAELQVVRLATELKARGGEVCVVSLADISYGMKARSLVSQLETQHIAFHSLGMKPGIPDLRALFRLRKHIRDFCPDVVHCHMYHANILGRITRLFCRIPVLICTAHNTVEASRRGGPTWHKELLYRATDFLADHTTIICDAGFRRYVRVGAVPRNKLCMIPNGIDTDVFSHSEEERQRFRSALGIGTEFVWLAVGRLVKQKDYPNLLRALELLPDKNFVVLVAGEGPLQGELQGECDKRGLGGRVRFCGARTDVRQFYNAADAFVMSSEMEGMPLVLLEAASMGLPAVVTDVGGNPEVVVDNVTGYVVPPANPVLLAAALQRVMHATPEQRRNMSRAARQHCVQRYRIATVMKQWLNLYAAYMPVIEATYEPRTVA